MLKYYITTLLCIAFCSTIVTAQSNTTFNKIATTESSPEWIQVKQNERVSKTAFIQQTKEIFELNNATELTTLKTQTDLAGWTHHRLQQTYQGVPIEGGEYILHEKNGVIHKANGSLISNMDLSIIPALSEAAALEILLQKINANEYAWQNENAEALLKYQYDDETLTYYPTGRLCLINTQQDKQAQNYQLSYQFDVYAIDPHDYHTYYVDAHTGDIIDEIPIFCHAQGTASTNYYGNQPFTTEFVNNKYRLHDYTRNIETYDASGQYDLENLNIVSTDNNNWTDPIQKTGSEAHWIAQETYDYFLNTHNLNSYDGFGGKLMIWVNYGMNEANAFGGGGKIKIGNGDGITTNPLSTIDIVSHEYTHNIIQQSSTLRSTNESGALNESFADIFGTILEKEIDPNNFDWLLGEDAFISSDAFRSMSDPNLYNDPDTYQGNFWHTSTNDHGGIHTNSGVQNYWFYLLAEGGSGTNDNGQSYNITGIGMDKAAQIAYRNMTAYLGKYSNYVEARNGSIQAAKDLYGVNSTEAEQVEDAWCAVGVGSCNTNITGTLTITSPNGGETLNQGIGYNITWNKTGNTGNSVKIIYSIDGGGTWQTITNDTPNNGSYNWIAPAISTTIALVEITSNDNNTILDRSNNYFTINRCDVTALFSTNNDTVCADQNILFTNQSTGLVNGAIWYINGTQVGNSNNLNYTFTQIGTYTVELHALKGSTCLDIYTQDILVQKTDGNFTHQLINSGGTKKIRFTAPSLNPQNSIYDWAINGSPFASTIYTNTTIDYPGNGTYFIALTINNDCTGPIEFVQQITLDAEGCMNPNANNYNSNAEIEDGSCTYPTPCPSITADSLALVALYNNLNGPSWNRTWDLSQPVQTWYGVLLSNDGCSVVEIDLSQNSLAGFLPNEIVSFPNLTSLDLSQNYNIFDTPSTPPLELLSNLTYLSFHQNKLAHAHKGLGMLTNLTYLDLSNNQFTGSIPTDLGNLTNLTYLNIFNNSSLTGSIPTELGNLTNLETLRIGGSQLTGSIPTELGNLTNLIELYISAPQMTGSIPPELGNLANLETINLTITQLTGSIPPELGNLTSLKTLYIRNAQLTGSIPTELGNLTNLTVLNLSNNQLTGSIPPELGNLINLQDLSINNNLLTGSIPAELGNFSLVHNLNISNNQLTSSIPPELGNIANGYSSILLALDFSNNQLTGTIPAAFGNLPEGEIFLNFSYNQLTGFVPSELFNTLTFFGIEASDNNLSGCYNQDFCNTQGYFNFTNNSGLPDNGSAQGLQDFCAGTGTCQDNPVYPGDFNFDGVANNKDVVTYGLHFGETGIARTEQDINWSSHESTVWGSTQENGFDAKHVDGDGNGIVDLEDMKAVRDNYGNTHIESPLAPPPTSFTESPVEIFLQPSVVPSFAGNDNVVEMDVMIANTQGGGELSMYGTAFQISYSDAIGLIDNVEFSLNNSWLGTKDQDLQYVVHNDEANQILEIGITRIDRANALGDGPIGKVTACINNITPWDSLTLAFDVDQIFASNSEAELLPIATNYTELGITQDDACANNLTIDPATNFQNTYEAANLIETVGDVIVQSGQSVEMRSSEGALNPNFEVKLGGDLYVTYDPCTVGNKPTAPTSNVTKKVAKDIAYSKDNNKINIDYLLKNDANVSMEILTMDKQLIERIAVGQKLAGQQQLSINRQNLPTGQLWVCLKQGRERYYFSIEN